MTQLLLRIFIKDYQKPDAPGVHTAVGTLAGVVGVVCNVLLFAAKLAMGVLSGSVSIIADAMNNLTDASSSVITLLGFRMAKRPADRTHPYGHARYEYLSGLVVAGLILLIGVELGQSSVGKIIRPGDVHFTGLTMGIMLLSILVKLWMAAFFRSLGRRIQSTTLEATAADSRNDVIATAAVLLGCVVHYCTGVNLDGWFGLAVAVFILYSGFGVAKETVSPLLGKQADEALVESISALVLRHEGILGVHDLLVHDYGPGNYFASVHVELSADEDPQVCHDIIDDIECDALRELNVQLVIHYDPVSLNDPELNEMRELVDAIIREIDPRLSMHDFRMVRSSKQSKLVFDLEISYEMHQMQSEIKARIDNSLRAMGKNYRTVIRFDGA